MSAQPKFETWMEEDYWELEEHSPVKHEFINGYPYAMAGGTYNHTTICTNLASSAKALLRGKPCRARSSEQKVKSESGNTFYPDAVIFCPPARFQGKGDHTLLTPAVIFEVLSPATADYDRTDKFKDYRRIETLTDYVLVEAERVYVDHYRRQSDGWLLRTYVSRGDILSFPDLQIELSLDEIYEELDVPEALALIQTPHVREDGDD